MVAYRTLASVAGVDVEALWRLLWRSRHGEVRASFVDTVSTLHEDATGQGLTTAQTGGLRAVADQLFALSRQVDDPAEHVMMGLWRIAFA